MDITEGLLKNVYRNRKGKNIYKLLYQKYNELFFKNLVEKTDIKSTFEAFKDTGLYERYLLNAAQFSAAKTAAESKMIQRELFDENKVIRSYQDFKQHAEQITRISQETWLRVEYESQRRQCVMSEQWRRMVADSDLYPYFVHKGRLDSREREEHVKLENKVYRIQDKESGYCFPPLDFNCRCEGEPVDEDYLKEHKLKPVTKEEFQYIIDNHVDPQFRKSPTAGTLPNVGSYFEVLKNGNVVNYQTFGLGDNHNNNSLEGLGANGFHYLMETIDGWRDKEHVSKNGNIVFQHKSTLSNVMLTSNSIHEIQKHSRGFENIPETVKAPDEVWSQWEDASLQMDTLRNYIKYGSTSFIVQTRNGFIVDAFAVSNKTVNKYRKGVIL